VKYLLVAAALFGCGDESLDESLSKECDPSNVEYTHSVLYCDRQIQATIVICDPSGNEERNLCSEAEEVLDEGCELVSVCCVEYVCRSTGWWWEES